MILNIKMLVATMIGFQFLVEASLLSSSSDPPASAREEKFRTFKEKYRKKYRDPS